MCRGMNALPASVGKKRKSNGCGNGKHAYQVGDHRQSLSPCKISDVGIITDEDRRGAQYRRQNGCCKHGNEIYHIFYRITVCGSGISIHDRSFHCAARHMYLRRRAFTHGIIIIQKYEYIVSLRRISPFGGKKVLRTEKRNKKSEYFFKNVLTKREKTCIILHVDLRQQVPVKAKATLPRNAQLT